MWREVLKNLPWKALVFAFGIDVALLGSAAFGFKGFNGDNHFSTTIFLVLFILLAHPLTDWFIARRGMAIRGKDQPSFQTFENRVARITHLNDTLEFLSWLIRAWRLTRVRLLVFDEEDFVYFLSRKKRARKMRLKDDIPESFRSEMAATAEGRSTASLSPTLKAYMQSRKVRFMIPLLFRERLIGLIGFSEAIEKSRLPLLDHAALRMSLAIENAQLERTVPRSEFLKKEFHVAERIERHLSGSSAYRFGTFAVQKLDTAWDKKHFAAIFGCTSTVYAGSSIVFGMLLRLSVASTRSNALQLFATQGYFYALARGGRSLKELATVLHNTLRLNEGKTLQIEGFLFAFSIAHGEIEIAAFGNHLAYRDESGWTWFKSSAAIGADAFDTTRTVTLRGQKEIILSMREYPLLLISGGIQ